MKSFIWSFLLILVSLHAEELPIMTLDSFADVYYDAETGNPHVSDEIKKLNGKTVRIAGYMVPFNSLENLKEFMLMPSSNGCNFCESPMKEEIIYVRQPGKKKYEFISEPLIITGKLWVNGAGTAPKNKTYAQFLYAFEDAKVEKLKKEHHALLEVVTPRTIIKQVCSLLRVRLLKQVRFEALNDSDYLQKRKELLLKYLGGMDKAEQLQKLLTAFDIPGADKLIENGSKYLANWAGAFSDTAGDVIYHRKNLDLSQPENQRQIAIASYDTLFHHEVEMGKNIHTGNPTYEELAARLSLILGLRQSFTQFYGSIGLIDLLPLPDFAKPHQGKETLPAPYSTIIQQLLVKNATFIEELYQSKHYQPYTKAIINPPSTMEQILKPELYTTGKEYKSIVIDGYENRFGPYLSSLILGISVELLVADGLNLTENGFKWTVQLSSEKEADKLFQTHSQSNRFSISLDKNTVVFQSVK